MFSYIEHVTYFWILDVRNKFLDANSFPNRVVQNTKLSFNCCFVMIIWNLPKCKEHKILKNDVLIILFLL